MAVTDREQALKASSEVSLLIAMVTKPHTIAETLMWLAATITF